MIKRRMSDGQIVELTPQEVIKHSADAMELRASFLALDRESAIEAIIDLIGDQPGAPRAVRDYIRDRGSTR